MNSLANYSGSGVKWCVMSKLIDIMVTEKRVRCSTYGYCSRLGCGDEKGWVAEVGVCVAMAAMWQSQGCCDNG